VTALDELAAYLGHPDRPFDARALELVTAALAERQAELPAAGHMGDDLDLPFKAAAPGSTIDLSDCVITGGWVVSAVAVPVPQAGVCPGLLFRFSRYDGHLLRPVLLVTSEQQMRKTGPLVTKATGAAIRAARNAA